MQFNSIYPSESFFLEIIFIHSIFVFIKFSIADAVNADEDGIILLENLKSSGFISTNRWDRFDRDEVLAILKVGFQIFPIHLLY